MDNTFFAFSIRILTWYVIRLRIERKKIALLSVQCTATAAVDTFWGLRSNRLTSKGKTAVAGLWATYRSKRMLFLLHDAPYIRCQS